MKKIFILLLLLATLTALSCGSNGAGPANVPPGENPGIASVIRLLAAQYIAQVNASIYLRAKVLDGNGLPVTNKTVTFTNLSAIGTMSSPSAARASSSTTFTAVTDSNGIASAKLDSGTSGFITIQAATDSGAGQIVAKNTVYFSTYSLTYPTSSTNASTLMIDVDSNSNGIYNEQADYWLFKSSGDNKASIRVTILDSSNMPVANTTITFGADSASATFPQGNTKTTDKNGQAINLVNVASSIITSYTIPLNITASAANGAANMTTLFLSPVVIDTTASHITATPSTVTTTGTSAINAIVMLNTGDYAPDATTVNFTATCGTVTPFAQTTSGVAPATFTPPAEQKKCTVIATVGATTVGTTDITSTTTLIVSPVAQTITDTGAAQFTIAGGTAPYKITTSDTSLNPSLSSVSSSGGTFTVTVPYGTKAKTVVYTIIDSVGTVVTATLTVMVTPPTPPATPQVLAISPSAVTVSKAVSPVITFIISGGTGPYSATSSNVACAFNDNGAGGGTAGNGIKDGTEGGTWTGANINVTISAACTQTSASITAADSAAKTAVAAITIGP